MTQLIDARIGAILTPDNLSGVSLTVAALSAPDGVSTVPVDVQPGDKLLGLTAGVPQVWVVDDPGEPWALHETQPAPGDLVVCTGADVPFQTGSLAVVLPEGNALGTPLMGVSVQTIIALLSTMTPPGAHALTPMGPATVNVVEGDRVQVISADTTNGDVTVDLGANIDARLLVVTNRSGAGNVVVTSTENVGALHPGETTVEPGTSVRCASFFGGWDIA